MRFVVSTTRPGHLVILGLDAAGKVSVYSPTATLHPRRRGTRQAMPGSIILDDTPGAERLVALECDAHFPVADAVAPAAASSTAPHAIPGGSARSACRAARRRR